MQVLASVLELCIPVVLAVLFGLCFLQVLIDRAAATWVVAISTVDNLRQFVLLPTGRDKDSSIISSITSIECGAAGKTTEPRK